MPTLVDTHAHLYASQFNNDRKAMVQRAIDNGVTRMYLPNVDSQSHEGLHELINEFPNHCFAMMGVHPCNIKDTYKIELSKAQQLLNTYPERYCAIGEIGLDFYWDITYKNEQIAAFKTQIEWAKAKKLPIIIHCRDSFAQTLMIVQQMNDDSLTGIFHCFGGTIEEAKAIIDLGGFYMGIGGSVTYKKNKQLRETIAATDLQHFVLETDSPYLAPEPFRSMRDKSKKRNESSYTTYVAEKIADIKGINIDEVAMITTNNALRLFKHN